MCVFYYDKVSLCGDVTFIVFSHKDNFDCPVAEAEKEKKKGAETEKKNDAENKKTQVYYCPQPSKVVNRIKMERCHPCPYGEDCDRKMLQRQWRRNMSQQAKLRAAERRLEEELLKIYQEYHKL